MTRTDRRRIVSRSYRPACRPDPMSRRALQSGDTSGGVKPRVRTTIAEHRIGGVRLARDESIDALRGLAIALVVAGHAIPFAGLSLVGGPGFVKVDTNYWVPLRTATDLSFNLIYAFHMPLFAFVSGLVFWPPRDASLHAQIAARTRGLLVPYFSWLVVLFVLAVVVPATTLVPPKTFESVVVDALVGRGGLLWYLYALFICATVVIGLSHVRRFPWLLPASALLAVLLRALPLPNVLYLSQVLWIYPFVVLGYLLRPMNAWVMNRRVAVSAIASGVFGGLFYLWYPQQVPSLEPIGSLAVAMHERGIRGGLALSMVLPYLCASAAILALYAIFAGRRGRAIDLQAWFGRKSLGVYAIHAPVLGLLLYAGVKRPDSAVSNCARCVGGPRRWSRAHPLPAPRAARTTDRACKGGGPAWAFRGRGIRRLIAKLLACKTANEVWAGRARTRRLPGTIGFMSAYACTA